MSEEEMRALFLLAGMTVERAHKLANGYWPDCERYAELRASHPWWLVQVPNVGLIKIGWRKRVINIDWTDTLVREEVTKDATTQEKTMVHAWGYGKAVEYLGTLKELAARWKWRAENPEEYARIERERAEFAEKHPKLAGVQS